MRVRFIAEDLQKERLHEAHFKFYNSWLLVGHNDLLLVRLPKTPVSVSKYQVLITVILAYIP